MHIQQLNQKYQYYLNESQRLNEELQEERVYIDLLESIISEILTAEDIDVLAEGEKRAKRIKASINRASERLAASREKLKAKSGNEVPDEKDTSPEAMAVRAGQSRIGQLGKAGDTATLKVRRRISKGLEADGLPTGKIGTLKSILTNMFLPGKEIDLRQTERDEQGAKHRVAVQHALKNRLDPESITSGSNAPKTAAKALEGGASPRDAAALVQRNTKDMPRNVLGYPAGKEMPQTAAQRIVKQVTNRKK
jgi:hypothetical protein